MTSRIMRRLSQAWWCMLAILVLLRLRQEDGQAKAHMNYKMRLFFSPNPPSQKKNKQRKKGEEEEEGKGKGRHRGKWRRGWEESLILVNLSQRRRERKAAEQVRGHDFSFPSTETGG